MCVPAFSINLVRKVREFLFQLAIVFQGCIFNHGPRPFNENFRVCLVPPYLIILLSKIVCVFGCKIYSLVLRQGLLGCSPRYQLLFKTGYIEHWVDSGFRWKVLLVSYFNNVLDCLIRAEYPCWNSVLKKQENSVSHLKFSFFSIKVSKHFHSIVGLSKDSPLEYSVYLVWCIEYMTKVNFLLKLLNLGRNCSLLIHVLEQATDWSVQKPLHVRTGKELSCTEVEWGGERWRKTYMLSSTPAPTGK